MIRIKRVLYIVYGFIVLVCLAYICQWQVRTQSKIEVRDQMKSQGQSVYVRNLFKDMKCFPVQEDVTGEAVWSYDNGYGEGRTYGGVRKHEGIDIMASNNTSGYFKVQSVSDGVVEQMGWLELGGYRIGIRSDNGFYFYYAHLASYAKGIQKGSYVKSGEVIGMMGDTGYGSEETKGKFDVHLHFGIYVDDSGTEKSINPYYMLKYIE